MNAWVVAANMAASMYSTEMERVRPNHVLVTDGTAMSWQPMPEPAAAVSAKCPCCGSRQFVTHQSRRICSYCRSEQ